MDHKQAALAFLKTKVVAVIATISSDGKPSASTIYFAVDDDFNFYFVTKVTTQKNKNLLTNHKIAMVVGTENIPITVQIEGEAQEIEEIDKKALALNKVSRNALQGAFGPPLNEFPAAEITVYKITPTAIKFLDQTDPMDKDQEPIQIIP